MNENSRDELRHATVRLVLDVRREYLMGGANPLKAWDQIGDRMRAATRMSTSPEEWASSLCRSLQIGQPGSYCSHSMADLAALMPDKASRREWLDILDREHGYLIALARLEAERRRDEREAERTDLPADAAVAGPDVTPPTKRRRR